MSETNCLAHRERLELCELFVFTQKFRKPLNFREVAVSHFGQELQPEVVSEDYLVRHLGWREETKRRVNAGVIFKINEIAFRPLYYSSNIEDNGCAYLACYLVKGHTSEKRI